MATTADHNTSSNLADTIVALPDAEFAKEFGLDIGDATDATATDAPTPEQDEQEPQNAPDPEPAPEAEPEGDADPAPDADADPEGDADPEPEKKPLAPFTVTLADGSELDEIPDIRLTFKAGRKVQENVPLDKIVRWAQSGFYAEQAVAERDQLKTLVPEVQAKADELAVALEDQRALNERLLADEEFFLAARDRFAQVNTPEHRAQRLEAQLRQREQRDSEQRLASEANGFITNTVAPILDELAKEYPTVTVEELFGRLTIEAAPLMRNGRIPRAEWNRVKDLLETSVAQYAEAQHARRDGDRVTSQRKATNQVTKAKEEATKAKRTLAKALTPAKTAAAAPSKPARQIRTIEDAADDVVDAVLSDMLSGN